MKFITSARAVRILFLFGAAALYAASARAEDCTRTFCGCWRPVTLRYETTVVDSHREPIPGIEIYCGREREPIAVSEDDGSAGFSLETMRSPGCHYKRCNSLRFVDPGGVYQDTETTIFATNGSVTVLRKRASE